MLTGGLRVLTPDAEAPRVPQTTMRPDLLQPLEIVTELRVNTVGQDLRVLAVDDIPLPVQEPCWDLELRGVLDDGHEPLELIGVQLAGTGDLWEEEVEEFWEKIKHIERGEIRRTAC